MIKKIIILIFCFTICFLNFPTKVWAIAQSTIFAKVEKSGVFFYNSPIDDVAYKIFEIPTTYFVELLGKAEDSENLFYTARYIDVYGYIKKADVTPVQSTPIKPFADGINFRVFSPNGLDLKSTPTNDTPFNRIVNVPYLCTDLVFYGTLSGGQMIPDKSSTWYYCKYITSGTSYYGFLYSDLCDKLPTIAPNTENLPLYEGELFVSPPPTSSVNPTTPSLSGGLKIVLALAIGLPCFLVVYFIFKPTRLAIDNGEKHKKKIKRIKRSDFYELED